MKLLRNLFVTTFLIYFNSVIAQGSSIQVEKKIYTTASVGNNESPVIDGILDDGVWNSVEWGSDFIENQPNENTQPSEQTKFKIVYDAKYLYIGVRAYDKSPDSIVKRLGRRDTFDGDWVEINIDSYHDLRTAFSFTASVSGVKSDEFVSNNGNNWDSSWNPIWTMKAQIDDEGWTCEMKIPLSQLRFSNDDNQVWGIQFTRRFIRKEERSVWQRKPQETPGWVSEFGELHGLKELKSQKQLEIQPFTVNQLETYPK